MIEVERLIKDYGTVVAVRDVSFAVGRGEVVGFLGPNGAGKSTTLRILAGFLGASSGQVRVNGFDLARDGLSARRSLGYMPEAAPLYPELRVREYLEFRARLKQVPSKQQRLAVERALERAHVREVSETVVGHLSKGFRQRVALADALLADPPLLILDEPTAGLDPNQVREVRKLIRELGEEHTLLLSTHVLSEVEATCQRALVIDRGKLVAQGTLSELSRGRKALAVRLVLRDPNQQAPAVFSATSEVLSVEHLAAPQPEQSRYLLALSELAEPASVAERLVERLVRANIGVIAVQADVPTLEQVFAELTRDDAS